MTQYNYCVDDYGNLHIFCDNHIIADVSECNGMSKKEIKELVEEILWELRY